MSFCLGPLDPSSLHHPQPARCSWLRQEDRTDLSQLMQPWQLRASHHTAPQEQMSQSHPSRSPLSQTVFSPTYSTLGAELRCSGTALLQVLSWEHNPKKTNPPTPCTDAPKVSIAHLPHTSSPTTSHCAHAQHSVLTLHHHPPAQPLSLQTAARAGAAPCHGHSCTAGATTRLGGVDFSPLK